MVMHGNRTIRLGLAAFCAAVVTAHVAMPPALAQAGYPNRPIKLVVPYPPGALTDLLARSIGDRLAVSLKQAVGVDNKPGAGTLVGAEFVAKQSPDGHTLLMATSTTLGISPALYRPSPVNPLRDFAPISQVGSDYPHTIGDMPGCLKRVNVLPDAARHKVRGNSARRLFGL
jgi:tripartite-type tricarboxylate transporter receptor subunit TctC